MTNKNPNSNKEKYFFAGPLTPDLGVSPEMTQGIVAGAVNPATSAPA